MYRCLTSVQNASRINTGRTGRQTAREEHNARALFSERERVMQVKNKISVRLIWLLLAVILAVSCVSGCSGSGDAAEDEQMRDEVDFIGDAVADQGTTAEADDKFTLRYSKEEPLNPITCDGVYNDAITSLIYEGLFRLTDKFEPVNVLCKDPFGWNGRAAIGKIAANPKAVEIVNRIMEDDIHVLAHVALDFAPDKSFHELWIGTNIQGALKKKGWDDAVIASKYQQIMDEFDTL